jgi:hypothetical protein
MMHAHQLSSRIMMIVVISIVGVFLLVGLVVVLAVAL